jgi:nondiscriminating glutamyl-tRNA synthetase
MSSPLRVRIAPSPTGAIHLGLARTALFNWAYARGRQGQFVLRLEDTDRARSTRESESAIIEGLRWLGLDWDEGPELGGDFGPYRQSERIDRHRELMGSLMEAGHAYPCFCTPERVSEVRERQQAANETPRYDRCCRDLPTEEAQARAASGEAFTVRFKVPPGQTTFQDLVRKDVTFDNGEIDDWVMVRQSGDPTYNFVVVCDDADMEITHVLRGEEHLVNTPKQVLLYSALGVDAPTFAHLPLLLGKGRKKLSKRDGSVSLSDYRDQGYPREAILNFLCMQGWALDGETDVFDLATFVEHFDLKDVSRGGAIFDFDKFLWLAGEYLHKEADEVLAEHCLPFVVGEGLFNEADLRARWDWYLRVIAMEKERIRIYSELPARMAYLSAPDDQVEYLPKAEKGARKHEGRVQTLTDYLAWLPEHCSESPAEQAEATKAWLVERGQKIPMLFQPLRCALTGLPGGPDLFEIMDLLGQPATLDRIRSGVERLA